MTDQLPFWKGQVATLPQTATVTGETVPVEIPPSDLWSCYRQTLHRMYSKSETLPCGEQGDLYKAIGQPLPGL